MTRFNPVTTFLKIRFDTPEEGQNVFSEIKYLKDNKNPLMPDLTVDCESVQEYIKENGIPLEIVSKYVVRAIEGVQINESI